MCSFSSFFQDSHLQKDITVSLSELNDGKKPNRPNRICMVLPKHHPPPPQEENSLDLHAYSQCKSRAGMVVFEGRKIQKKNNKFAISVAWFSIILNVVKVYSLFTQSPLPSAQLSKPAILHANTHCSRLRVVVTLSCSCTWNVLSPRSVQQGREN